MAEVKFSTIVVPESKVNLGHTVWGPSFSMPGRETAFIEQFEEQLKSLKTIFREHGEDLSALSQREDLIKIYRHYSSWKKLPSIISIVREELMAGAYDKVVLFSQHADLMKYCQAVLREFFPVTLYVKTNPYTAEKNLRKFNNKKSDAKIFCSIIKAAKPPVVLGAASFAFFLQDELNTKDNLEAILRLNDTDKIYVRNFSLDNDSTDRRIQELIRSETLDLSKRYYYPSTEAQAHV
jgi:hypothetical protein